MSSLLDHLDSNQSENDDIHLLFPKCKLRVCKPRASSTGTESQSSESQSNSQQYLADNFRDQNLNHPSSASLGGGGGSTSARQSSRRHSSSGFTHHHHHHSQQQLPDNLLKHSKHTSYPPLLTTVSPTITHNNTGNNSYIGHGPLSPYDNNNLTHDIVGITNNKSDTRSSSHDQHHHPHSSSRHHQHLQHLQQQQQQSDSSDNFPLTPSFSSSSNFTGNNGVGIGSGILSSSNSKKGESHNHQHHHHHHSSSGGNSIKSHHHHHSHSRSKNSISSRNSRHESVATSALSSGITGIGTNSCQSQTSRHHSRSSHHHHNTTERSHHRSKRITHMTESSSCEPISPATVNKTSSSRYNKSQKSLAEGSGGGGGPTKSYSTLSLGSGMECEPLDDHHYDDSFCTTRSSRNLATSSNGASSYNSEHSSSTRTTNNIPGNGGCLRDSRIEIAGGREVYSQNRIRAGRRLRGSSSTSSSTEMMADSSMSMTASSSSSVGTKSRKKSPNVQPQLQQQQHQPQLVCTNGDDDGGVNGEHSVWEPKHPKSYQENAVVPSRSHHSSSHRHHGSQHHHHHHHQQHHHHQSHARNRHVCGYPHCDHTKVLSSADMSPACGGSYNKSSTSGPNMSHNSSNTSSSGATPMTVKETVFSTEITSIEKPIESESTSKVIRPTPTSPTMQPPYIYETPVNDGRGEIIFDDIGNWGRNGGANREGGGNSNNGGCSGGAAEGGLCTDRGNRKEASMMKRSPSSGGRSNAPGAQLNILHSDFMGENESGMHCCGLEDMNHSGSSMNTSSAPTVLLQGSPSPSTRGGNTTPSGYESDEYSGVTPVSLNMLGCNNKGCLPNNRLIGAVPIAEYEGSPKRYGLRQPTHPMPTHLDLVDVDMPMDNSGLRSPSEINCGSGGGGSGNVSSSHHVVSLMSPSQPSKPTAPTTASSSSSSSLDNTNSNTSSTSSNRNLYSSRISPRVLSPSQSVSNFPSRVPGFPQRITPITSSLDSSSLVDSGLEKSEATDIIKSDMLETEGDMLVSNSCHPNSVNNDECPQQQDHNSMRMQYQQQQQPQPHYHRHHQQQQISHLSALSQQQQKPQDNNSHSLRSSDIDEPPSSTSLCQGQLVNSDHSSDLLLTDQLNIKSEKCTPSSTTNLCGNPLVDESQQMHHHVQQHQQQHHHHNMVLELVDSASLSEDHHQSLQQHHQQSTIHSAAASATGTGDESTKQRNATSHITNNSDSLVDDQCLISVPSSSSDIQCANDNSGGTPGDGHNLLGIGANSSDYLYEFSETRKVLEEFFGSASVVGGASGGGGSSAGVSSTIIGLDGSSMNQGPLFDELDYTLKRQAGNSYVGQRLAGESCNAVEESPKKPARRGVLLIGSSDGDGGDGGEAASPRLISFQEITLPQIQQQQQQQKSAQNPPRDLNDNDIDGDTSSTNTETDNLGDTEVGLQVGLSRNFTLSPETTDCDSNELESEISLDYEASLHSSSRAGVSMPAVEDGLSSGNVSDTEETVPSSDQLSHDLKRVAQHQGLLCSSTSGSSNNPCSSNAIINNNSCTIRQQLSSSSGIGGVHSLRREHPQQIPSAHHQHHHHHHHLIEDGLGCNGTQQGAAVGVSLPSSSSSSSATNNSTSAAQNPLQTSTLSAASQQQHPVSPSSSSSISTTKIPSDPNPTLLLMKKQISEIEKEIKMRASQQSQKIQLQHHSLDTPNNSHNNSAMPVADETGSTTTNITSLNNGNSCVTSNGNGLASQLNVSSCPDVSALNSNGSSNTGSGAGGQGSCYAQQQLSSSSSTGNGPAHRGSGESPLVSSNGLQHTSSSSEKGQETTNFDSIDIELEALDPMRPTPPPSPAPSSLCQPQTTGAASGCTPNTIRSSSSSNTGNTTSGGSKIPSAVPINIPTVSGPPGSSSNSRIPTSTTESNASVISPDSSSSSSSVAAAIQDIKEAIQRTKTLPRQQPSHVETSRPSPLTSSQSHADAHNSDTSPVWVPRQGTSSYHHHRSGGGVKDPLLRKQRYDETPDDDADTDQETDRLLGQTRTEDDYGFYDEKEWKKVKNCRSLLPALNKGVSFVKSAASGSVQPMGLSSSASSLNTGAGSNSSNNHGVPYSSTSNTIAPSSARISPAPFKQQQEPLPSSQLNSSSSNNANNISNKPKKEKDGIKKKRSKEDFKNPSVLIEGVLFRARYLGSTQLVCEGQPTKATRMMQAEEAVSRIKTQVDQSDLSSETEPLGTLNVSDSAEPTMHSSNTTTSSSTITAASTSTTNTATSSSTSTSNNNNSDKGEQAQPHFQDYLYPEDDDSGDESCAESEFFHKGHHAIQSPTSSARSFQGPCFGGTSPGDPGTLAPSAHFGPACGSALPGTMFRLKFIGSLEVDEEVGSGKRRRKRPKKTMVEEAVMKMKAPEGETQPSTEVDLFISTEKIMVLNTDLKEIMMDHALRTISYIADIGDLVVLMARRRPVPSDTPDDSKIARPPKMICHVFESDEAQYIAQSIGQAFQVAYMEFLKANGIEDQSFVREMDYQEVLNSQEIFGDELQMFAKKELQKEVVVPKSKGEILGVVIVESGWGSMLPTVVIANLAPAGAAARCGQLNIGDQIIAINGVSLVGLPLSTCQNYIKNTKSQTVVKLTVVPCPPVVEVKIKRPDTKYQLGFSVQNGVICSLLRGGIAERGGVRVGHRIIEINGQSVVAVPHEKIVNLLATSVGEINMKTMPTSMFRLLTGQETPLYI